MNKININKYELKKNKSYKYCFTTIVLIIVLLFTVISICFLLRENIIEKYIKNNAKNMQEETIKIDYELIEQTDDKQQIILYMENKNEIDKISLNDGVEIECNRKKIAIDRIVKQGEILQANIKSVGEQPKLYTFVGTPDLTMEKENHTVTINYPDIHNVNKYYSIDEGETWQEYTQPINTLGIETIIAKVEYKEGITINKPSRFEVGEKIELKAGDYVAYPVEYENVISGISGSTPIGVASTDTRWRVAYTENNIVRLVAAGTPEAVFFNSNNSQNYNYINSSDNFTKYLNNKYATNVRGALTISEIRNYNINWLQEYVEGKGMVFTIVMDENLKGLYYYSQRNSFVSVGSNVTIAIRPVVTLKPNVKVESGLGTKDDPYILNVAE